MGCWSDEICACGRNTPSIDQFLQRSHQKVVNNLGEKKKICMARRPCFLEMRESLPVGTGIQFLQSKPGHLHVFIETSNIDDEVFSTALDHLKTEFIVTHEFVNQPVLRENGKRTLFI